MKGLTNRMYAIVKKVVVPANTSLRQLVPDSVRRNQRSNPGNPLDIFASPFLVVAIEGSKSHGERRPERAGKDQPFRPFGSAYARGCYSHSIVAGGLEVMSYTTRFTPSTSPTIRLEGVNRDRKSTRLNSSHVKISYAVFCLKKKTNRDTQPV